MSTQRNSASPQGGPTLSTHGGVAVDESVLRALEADSRLLVAFPWARHLSPEQRARFAEELAHHPADMSNAAIEALLVAWRATADAAHTAPTRQTNASRQTDTSQRTAYGAQHNDGTRRGGRGRRAA